MATLLSHLDAYIPILNRLQTCTHLGVPTPSSVDLQAVATVAFSPDTGWQWTWGSNEWRDDVGLRCGAVCDRLRDRQDLDLPCGVLCCAVFALVLKQCFVGLWYLGLSGGQISGPLDPSFGSTVWHE